MSRIRRIGGGGRARAVLTAVTAVGVGLAWASGATRAKGDPAPSRHGPGRTAQEAPAAGPKTVRDKVYSEAQAARGEKLYRSLCLRCHPPDAFAGDYMKAWRGQPANALFELIEASMPQENPGSLTRDEGADLLAYIFKQNGWPAGDADLKSTTETLKAVVLEGPGAPGDSSSPVNPPRP